MFSMSRTLLVRFSGMLDEPWVQWTQLLRKIMFFATKFINHVLMSFGLNGSCVCMALEDASRDLHSVFLVVQEMLNHWAQFAIY